MDSFTAQVSMYDEVSTAWSSGNAIVDNSNEESSKRFVQFHSISNHSSSIAILEPISTSVWLST